MTAADEASVFQCAWPLKVQRLDCSKGWPSVDFSFFLMLYMLGIVYLQKSFLGTQEEWNH